MFRRLNKSAIWHLCQRINHWLWNSSKLPFTGAVLQSPSPPNTRVPWADHRGRACRWVRWSNQSAHAPAMVGPGYGRLVGRSVGGIKFLTLFRCAGSFTWATRIPSSGQH